jgi:hypothetical protein
VTGLSVRTTGQDVNQLFTYLDTTSVQLLNLDFTQVNFKNINRYFMKKEAAASAIVEVLGSPRDSLFKFQSLWFFIIFSLAIIC